MRFSRCACCRAGLASGLVFALFAAALSSGRAGQDPSAPPRLPRPPQVLPTRVCATPAFAAPLSLATGCCPTLLVVGDFDGDGHQDLLHNEQDGFAGYVEMRAGDGRGNFGFAHALSTDVRLEYIVPGDFTGDGQPEVALAGPRLLRNNNGRFTLSAEAFNTLGNRRGVPVARGDFNGDGKPDLALFDRLAPEIILLAGDGAGRFSASPGLPFKLTTDTLLAAAADFNRDGRADLVIADQTANELMLLLSQANGALVLGATQRLAQRPTAVVTGDFDRDGRVDVAVANRDVSVLFNQPNGSLVSQTVTTGGAGGLTAGNFDGDEWLDLAVNFAGRVTLLRGSAGGFMATSFHVGAGGASNGESREFIASGDFNEDGRQDLALALNGRRILILVGDGAGAFNLPPSFAAGATPRLLGKGDFNRDAIADVVTANLTDEVNVLLGGRAGFGAPLTFTLPPVQAQPFAPYTLLTEDFNRDGFTDCAIGGAQGIYLLTGGAGGTLQLVNDAPLPYPALALRSADFNADDWPDLAVHDGGRLRVLFNQARQTNPAFTAAPVAELGRPSSTHFLAGRFDADARADVIFFDPSGFIGYRVTQGDGAGGFTVRGGASISDGAGVAAVVGDFGGTGRLDLATLDYDVTNNEVALHFGYAYQRGTGARVLADGRGLSVGDLNGDGRDDLVEDGLAELAVVLFTPAGRVVLPSNQTAGRSYNGYGIGGVMSGAVVDDFDNDGRRDIAALNLTTDRLVFIRNVTQANQAPTLRANAPPLNLQQGAVNAQLKLAEVRDADATPGALNAVALGLPANFPAGLTVEGGALYGNFNVPCDAALGPRQIEIVLADQCLAQARAALTLNLQPNPPPQLGAYPDTVLTGGAAALVKPNAPPSDNGAFTLAVGAAGFNGALTVDQTSGEVRIANAAANGVFTVVVTATDRCGAAATQRFTLTVNLPGACGATAAAFVNDTFPLTHHPTLLATADFDRDGRLDLAAANLSADPSATITLLRGAGAGRLESWKTLRPAGFAAGLLAGDFNNDGRADLAYSYNAMLEVLLGDGNGEFAPPRRTDLAQTLFTVVSADLNRDGWLDLAGSVAGRQQLVVLFGDGSGGFAGRTLSLPTDAARLVSGDFNADGWADLAVTTFRASLLVLPGTGGGEFAAPRAQALPFTDFSTSHIVSADFNRDGKPDLAVTGIDATTRDNVTLALLGDGAGSFIPRPANSGGGPLAVADFDRDGRPDLLIVTGAAGPEGVLWLPGAGDGNFCAAKGINPATANTERRAGLAVADFDQDNQPDIVLAAEFFWQLTLLLNRTPP